MLRRVWPLRPCPGAALPRIAGLWLAGVVVAGGASDARADVVYQWTDQRGVVHFSDMPPPAATDVRQRELPAPAAAAPAAATPLAPTAGVTPAAPGPERASGQAHVVLASAQTTQIAPNAVRVVGTVRNDGDTPAHGVRVVLSANDAGQNNPCLERPLAVQPEALQPRESGAFDAVVESPCLFGDPPLQLRPTWE